MTHRPHDALFKSAFAAPAHAAALLRELLPAALREAIAWDRLKAEPASFVDVALADQHGDLLFSTRLRTGRAAALFLLLEHQSTADPTMPIRGLRYQLRIWERLCKRPRARWLPPIFAVVISHAKGRWTAPRSLEDMLDPRIMALPGAAELVPRFSLIIADLTQLTDDDLKRWSLEAFPKLALWLLRDASDAAQILRSFETWISTMLELQRAADGIESFHTLLNYMFHVIHWTQHHELHAKLALLGSQAKEIEVTIAEYLHEKGRMEGRITTLRRLLLFKFQLEALEARDEARLQAATPEVIDRYFERILTADSLAAVFGK